MLQVTGVSLTLGSKKLFEDVNLKFTNGNCYGVIGANGAGKSTFLKVLAGDIDPQKGEVSMGKNERMSVLSQNQNAFDDCTVLRTVLLGHKHLVDIMDEKDFSLRLAQLREKKGVSARDMSLSIGQNPGYINNIESGKSMPSLSGIFYICDYLGITPSEFFDLESQNPTRLNDVIKDLKRLNDKQLEAISTIIKDIIKE